MYMCGKIFRNMHLDSNFKIGDTQNLLGKQIQNVQDCSIS